MSYRQSNGYGESIVGTVSGTSISFGTSVVFNSGTTSFMRSSYDSANKKIVIAYQIFLQLRYLKWWVTLLT